MPRNSATKTVFDLFNEGYNYQCDIVSTWIQETKNILGRLILKHFKKDPEDSKLNLIKSDDFIYDFVSDL